MISDNPYTEDWAATALNPCSRAPKPSAPTRRLRSLLVVVSCLLCLAPAVQAQNWQLVWSDEFNYTGYPDSNRWRPEVWPPAVVNEELQHYTNNLSNAHVSNGTLKITATAVYNPNTGQNDYYSARLNSTQAWTYGRFEARIRVPGGWGTWPAFWLYPVDQFRYGTNPITNFGWPNAGEIDIMEHVGYDQNVIHASTHSACCFWAVGTQRTGTITVNNPVNNWHVYAAEWYEDRIEFYVNNTNYFTVWNDGTGWQSWPFNHDFQIILNLAVGGLWGGAQGVDPNIWPRTMEVDYVRVYQLAGGGAPGQGPGTNHNLPGTVQAQNYHWMSGIQTESTSDSSGDQNVGWIDTGDWMTYNVNVPSSGTYTVSYRVASPNSGGVIRFEQAGGGTVYGNINVPNTGGWQNWTTISHNVQLSAGQQEVAIYVPSGGYNINWFSIHPAASSWSTQIQAENYVYMSGVQTENTSDSGGGLNVGWIDAGDWMVWNTNLPSSGTYTVEYRVASPNSGGSIRFEQGGGGTVYGTIGVPNTGGWQNWTTISHNVQLNAGQQLVAIYVPSGGYNINWLRITRAH